MKKILPAIYLLLHFSNNVFSQDPALDWVQSVDLSQNSTTPETGSSVTSDANGYIYSTGVFENVNEAPNDDDIFIQKLDDGGNLIWRKIIGTTWHDVAYCIRLDSQGNVYVAGRVNQPLMQVDMDPGPGVHYMTSYEGFFLLKLTNDGQFSWALPLIGRAYSFGINAQDEVVISGKFEGTVFTDMESAQPTMSVTSAGLNDAYVQKVSTNGVTLWSRTFGGTGEDAVNSVELDDQGNILLTGFFSNQVDFDPGPGNFSASSQGGTDAFLLKLDENGNFLWTKKFGGTGENQSLCSSIDHTGNIFLSGNFQGQVDFDSGTGIQSETSAGITDLFLEKLDANGNFLWVKIMSGTETITPFNIQHDSGDNIYLCGGYSGSMDFDPGAANHDLNEGGFFFGKLSQQGEFDWAYAFRNSNPILGDIHINAQNEFYMTGSVSETSDFDLDPVTVNSVTASQNDAMFICKYLGIFDACSYLDVNLSSVTNVSCVSNGTASAEAVNGTSPYTYTWNTVPATLSGDVSFEAAGLYTLTYTDNLSCSKTKMIIVNGPEYPSSFDLVANLVSGIFRPGFEATVGLDVLNDGCLPATGSVSVIIDPNLLAYISSDIAPNDISGDTLTWNFSDLTYNPGNFAPQIHFQVNTSAAIGDMVNFKVIISPDENDADPSNNLKSYSWPVINGYDPNDIKVSPGKCDENFALTDQKLTYTIRFQNTGNAEAVNITVLDSISPFLDLNTMRITGSSFEGLYTEIHSGNVAKFHFDSIMLPDSANNEAGSHGYIIYDIGPLSNAISETAVKNHAEIYFDFNPAVITNTVTTTLVDEVPNCLTSSIAENEKTELKIYPNPTASYWKINSPEATSWTLMNALGQELMQGKSLGNFEIDARRLNTGVYLLKTESGIQRLIKE